MHRLKIYLLALRENIHCFVGIIANIFLCFIHSNFLGLKSLI